MLLPPMGLDYNLTPSQIDQLTQQLALQLRGAEDDVVAVEPSQRTFGNTLAAWQQTVGTVATMQVQATLPAMVSSNREARQHASTAKERLKAAFDMSYARTDLYHIFNNLPRDGLNPVQNRLLEATLCLFRQNGTDLPDEQRNKLMALRSELTRLEFRYQQNLNEDTTTLYVSREQLAGCSTKFIDSLEQRAEDGHVCVTMKPPDVLEILQRCENADMRRQVLVARDSRCATTNMPLLLEILHTRAQIAKILGKPSHAAARIQYNMAKTPESAEKLMNSVLEQVKPVSTDEIRKLKELKREHTATTERVDDVVINLWDIAFYSRMLRERTAHIDEEALRQYFPLDHVRNEIFRLYEEILGVQIIEAEPQLPTWHDDVKAFTVIDSAREEILGHFYLDLFPREGKYSHQCVVPLCPAYRRPNGTLQLPVAANIGHTTFCDGWNRLVLTFFHEFGHVMHHLSARTEYCLQSWAWSVVPYPAGVEHDYLEIPSQALENWTWEATVLKRLSRHVNTGAPLPDEEIKRLQTTRMLGEGIRYCRQIFLSLIDLFLHGAETSAQIHRTEDLQLTYDRLHRTITGLEPVPGTAFLASWYHIAQGYDAGYYGYLWSEVLACDVYSKFTESSAGCMNRELGIQYRRIMLEPGASVAGEDMIRKFLDREPNPAVFQRRFFQS